MTQTQIEQITPAKLMPLNNQEDGSLPFNLIDYLELVDWTGRIIRDDKRGYIKQFTPPILERLSVDLQEWLIISIQFEKVFHKKFNKRIKTVNSS